MKKLYGVFFAFMMVCAIVLVISPAGTINAQEVVPTQESAPVQQTASLEDTTPPEADSIKITRTAICKDVMDLEPVEAGEIFDPYVDKLYCFTKVVGAKTPIEVTHAWYYGDNEMAKVNLPVRSTSWRTYSSKIIMADAVGNWHVDVIGPEGEVLKTVEFKIVQ